MSDKTIVFLTANEIERVIVRESEGSRKSKHFSEQILRTQKAANLKLGVRLFNEDGLPGPQSYFIRVVDERIISN